MTETPNNETQSPQEPQSAPAQTSAPQPVSETPVTHAAPAQVPSAQPASTTPAGESAPAQPAPQTPSVAVPVAPPVAGTQPMAPTVPSPVAPQTPVSPPQQVAVPSKSAEEESKPTPEIPENHFIVYPENEAVVKGESRSLPPFNARIVFYFGLPFVLIGIILIVITFLRWNTIVPAIISGTAEPPNTFVNGFVWTLITFLFNVFVLGLYLSGFTVVRKRKRLEKRGQIVWGEVLAASSVIDRQGDFHITVEYRFPMPNRRRKKYIEDSVNEDRNDLRGKSLPEPGTPIPVLYLNPKNYEVL